MTPLRTVNLLRVLFVTFCAAIGALIFSELQGNTITGLLVGLVAGLVIVLIDRLLQGITLRAFSSATFGLLLGLIFATLLRESDILRFQPESTQWIIRLIVYVVFGYLGMMLAMRSNRDEFSLIIPYVRFARERTEREPLVLDTSAIIDGRIADLCTTGFLSRALIVPSYVLSELQALSDSREPIKRERGRRGLDILNQLRRSREVELTIHESEGGDGGVDEQLVRTTKLLQARLLTNDSALSQIARLQQVPALNLNDLSRALRPSVLAGDEMELQLIKEGRDAHQAVGYLPDGTMIVVNQARTLIGSNAKIVVSSSLQTAAGRLIFAELKNGAAGTAAG
ncbi:MAG: twitching motility protein PilT [Candidatus Nephthysia bennettiae]|nr:MAG: twitching motility protein PilT [Candidatus Dormibacteraeota bacterium]